MSDLDQRLVRALAHPLRVKILQLLEEGPNSPIGLSERMGEKLGNVSYHVKALLNYECIELVDTEQRRGATEHIYALKSQGAIGARPWQAVPPSLRTHFAGSALAGFTSRAIEALDAGTVETREGSGLTWLPLNVDEQGWMELKGVLANVEKRFRAVADKSAERRKNPKDAFSVIVAVAAFEIASGGDDEPS